MSVELLSVAADAMNAEAGRLEAMDTQSTAAPWAAAPRNGGERRPGWVHNDKPGMAFDSITTNTHPSDAVLIANRRNTIARDAATLRALATTLAAWAGLADLDPDLLNRVGGPETLAIARAFLGQKS